MEGQKVDAKSEVGTAARSCTKWEDKSAMEKILTQVWTPHVKEEFDVGHPIQTTEEFSYAIAVVDRIGGWIEGGRIEDGNQIGGRLAACKWIYPKGSHLQWAKLHGRIQDQEKVFDYGSHQVGLYKTAGSSRVDFRVSRGSTR